MTAAGLLPRFWNKVLENPDTGCWEWSGAIGSRGYAHFRVKGKTEKGHRLAYEALVAEIPDGLVADHLCRNRRCVNPWHIELVRDRENILRGESPAARRARQTHCKYGHPLSGTNVYCWRTSRICRTCAAERKNRVRL